MFEVNKDPDIFFYTGHKHNVKTATHHSVSIHLRSRHTNWHNTLHCAILSNITGTPSTELDISSWKIPKDINLADEQFDQPGSIDLLIGADILRDASTRQADTSWQLSSTTRDSSCLDTFWSDSNYFHTEGTTTYIPA